MPHPLLERIARSRVTSTVAVLGLCAAIAVSGGVAQGRVNSLMGSNLVSSQSQDTTAKVTGGGTVLAWPTYPTTIASFGLNARRAPGYTGGPAAVGRVSYDRHRNSTGRHVNAPVTFMQAFKGSGQTGGSATIAADCTPPAECDPFEGGTLRSGNIQVRGDVGVLGEQISTAAAAGIFPTTPTFNGVDLAGGIYSLGVRSGTDSTYGDVHAEFTGISPLGLYQIISVDGWITSGSIAGGTLTFSGTATLDMGDGPPPTGGLSLSGTLTATGITMTVNGSALPALPKTDGFTVME